MSGNIKEIDERYRVVEEIGSGAASHVYKAEHKMLGEYSAIKVLKKDLLVNETSVERFQQEAKLAMRLDHAGIVKITGYGKTPEGEPFIAMRYYEGQTLEELLAEARGAGAAKDPTKIQASNNVQHTGDVQDTALHATGSLPKKANRLSAETIVSIGKQIADALSYAHSFGIVHRDIKPANILLLLEPDASTGRRPISIEDGDSSAEFGTIPPVSNMLSSESATNPDSPLTPTAMKNLEPLHLTAKILDFGVAKDLNAGANSAASLTQTASRIGTPNYMSPEQCLGKEVDARSDIYALGAVLYECFTGRKPFEAESDIAVMDMHLHAELSFRPEDKLSTDLQAVLKKCMAKTPADRYQSADELSAALTKANTALKAPSRGPVIIVVALAISAIVSLAFFYVQERQKNSLELTQAPQKKEFSKPSIVPLGDGQRNSRDYYKDAHSAMRHGDYRSAEKLFKSAQKAAKREGLEEEAASYATELAELYTKQLDEHGHALAILNATIEELKQSKNATLLAAAYVARGDSYKSRNEYELALSDYMQAIKLLRSPKLSKRYRTMRSVILCYVDMGDKKRAYATAKQNLKELNELKLPDTAAKDSANVDEIHRKAEKNLEHWRGQSPEEKTVDLCKEWTWAEQKCATLALELHDFKNAEKYVAQFLSHKDYTYERSGASLAVADTAIREEQYDLAKMTIDKGLAWIGKENRNREYWAGLQKCLQDLEQKTSIK